MNKIKINIILLLVATILQSAFGFEPNDIDMYISTRQDFEEIKQTITREREEILLHQCFHEADNSCFQLGTRYYYENEIAQAIPVLKVGCDAKDKYACLVLSHSYYNVSISEYLRYLKMSCTYGLDDACQQLYFEEHKSS